MKSVFQHSGKTFKNGFFLSAKFVEGQCGVLEVYQYNQLKLDPKQDERVYFNVVGGKSFEAAQEPQEMSQRQRETEPYNRTSPYTYIGYGFGSLEVVPTSNGSRFLAMKKASGVGECSSSVDDDEVAVLCDDKNDLGRQLEIVLPKVGVPNTDVSKIKALVLGRF